MKRGKAGFTLTEILIVVTVIAVLAAVSVPVFASVADSAHEAACQANRRNALALYRVYLLGGGADFDTGNEVMAYVQAQSGNGITCPSGGTISYVSGVFVCSAHAESAYIFDKAEPAGTLTSLTACVSEWFASADRSTLGSGTDGVLKLLASGGGSLYDLIDSQYPGVLDFDESLKSGSLKIITTATGNKTVAGALFVSVLWDDGGCIYIAYAASGSRYKVDKKSVSGKAYYRDEGEMKNGDGTLKDGITLLS
ncbi:MAG: type II secretion system protein [Clostridia bacterium]|nr:type II secretion system protein [Clostridia bacterium]